MTNKLSILLSFSLLLMMISCKKEENKIFYEGGNPPVLSASATTVSLESGQEANTALVLTWTNPDYKFTTGISSQDVTYTLEMDTLGANFSSSKIYTFVLPKDLSKTYTVGELNAILGNDMQLQLSPRRNYTLQLRITSSIGSNLKLISNVVSFTTKPFAPPPKVAPPTSGTLFIVGSAVAVSGWNNPISPASQIPIQQFTMISSTLFQISLPIIGGGEYKLIAVNGSWNDQWSTKINDDPNSIMGGDFIFNGQNVLAPPASGNYKIVVDFQRGKFTLTKLP